MSSRAKPIEVREGKPVYALNAQGSPVCGYHKRDGTLCQSQIRMANGRCRIHKGGAAKGLLAPNYKGGTSSVIFKALPEKLHKAALASLYDPEQISLESNIAVLDANTVRILRQLDSRVGGDVYKRLSEGTEELDALLTDREPDVYELRRAWAKLTSVIEAGTVEALTWSQIQTNLEQRRKLTETQQKYLAAQDTNVSAKEFDTFVATVLNIIKTTVTEPRMRTSAGRKILALVDPVAAAKLNIAQDMLDQQVAPPTEAAVALPVIQPEVTELDEDEEAVEPEDELIKPLG